MNYTYEINSENKTIVVKANENLISKEVATMELEILLKAKKLDYKVIFDHRYLKNRISIGEAYFWYSTKYEYVDNELMCIPTAYIANKDDLDFYSFYESACNEKGIHIKLFHDENALSEWLNSC
jgi:hypothetical protein